MKTRRMTGRRGVSGSRVVVCEGLEQRVLLDGDDWWGYDDWDSGSTDTGPADTQTSDGGSSSTQPSDTQGSGDWGDTGSTDNGSSDGGWVDTGWDTVPEEPVYVYPPGTPGKPALQVVSSSSIYVSWAGSSDSPDGYLVSRFGSNGKWMTIANVGSTHFTDNNLQQGTPYSYSVQAYNDGGYSDWSDYSTIVIPVPDDPTLVGTFGHVPHGPNVVKFSFLDSDGTDVTLALSGAGSGTLRLTDDGYELALSDTTMKSSLKITTEGTGEATDDGRFTLESLTVGDSADPEDHTSLGSLIGTTTDLEGQLDVAGVAGTVKLGGIGDGAELDIGSNPLLKNPTVSLTLGVMENVSLISETAIKNLSVTDWLDTDATTDVIDAPAIGTLTVKGDKKNGVAGDFAADIETGSIGTLTIKGSMVDSQVTLTQGVDRKKAAMKKATILRDVIGSEIHASGNIGTFTARSMVGSELFAGMNGMTDAALVSAADIAGTPPELARIGRVTLTGFKPMQAVLVDSSIAAGGMDYVNLGGKSESLVSEGGALTPFGFVTRVGVIKYKGPGSMGLFVGAGDSVIV